MGYCTKKGHNFFSNNVCVACDDAAPRYPAGDTTMNEREIINMRIELEEAKKTINAIREMVK